MASVNFFDRQATLRRLTVRMLILTTIGSIGVACLGAVVSGYMYWARVMETSGIVDPLQLQSAALIGAAVTFTCTLLAVCFEFVKLTWVRGSVRHFFHASKIDEISRQRSLTPPEKRLLNVVDEMSIAASLPRPQIQLLIDDQTINSFALFRGNRQAIIGVTAGAVTQLSREELQALIAHELAHIANGDAAINVSVLALIRGIRSIYDASVTV
jgi:Zn-dependent protease with chaperone function